MTTIQICALIALITVAVLLVWGGYIIGRSEGLETGMREGENNQRAVCTETIRELQASLQSARIDQSRLEQTCKSFEAGTIFGPGDRHTLVATGEILRIAAETFSAFRTGKKLERDARTLHEKTIKMATRLPQGLNEEGRSYE
ncbi:hypothetical protein [Pseudomonas fluorescens]|uniref:hypothetical protein n=1 Tax=Pseudomonas fluorescens TaxID=294 RepID=UPI00054B46E8|nr:hypothetical protein [Pseudomonas fluorescens]KII28374.1 hypothetical protein RY26_28840 [Pseudomonas fluorescens]